MTLYNKTIAFLLELRCLETRTKTPHCPSKRGKD